VSIWSEYLERLKTPQGFVSAVDEVSNILFPALGTAKKLSGPLVQQASKLMPSDEGLKAAANRKEEEFSFTPLGIAKGIVKTAVINPLDNLASTSYALYRYPQAATAVPWLYLNPDNPLYDDGIQLNDFGPQAIQSVYDSAFKQITPGQAQDNLKQQVYAFINKSLGFNNSEPINIWNPTERDYVYATGPWKENFRARLNSGTLDAAYSILLDPLNVIGGAGVGVRTALLGKKGLIQSGAAFQKLLNRESTSVLRDFVLNRDALAIKNHPFVKGTFDPQATAAAFAKVDTPAQFELALGAMTGYAPAISAAETSAYQIFDSMLALRGKTKTLQSEIDTLRSTGAPTSALDEAERALQIHKEQMNANIFRYQFLDNLINPETGVLWAINRGYQGTPFASIARLQARQADARAKTIIGAVDEAPQESYMLVRGGALDEVFSIGTRLSKDRPSGIIGVRGFPASEFTAEVEANLNRLPSLRIPSTTVKMVDGTTMSGPDYKRDLLNRAISAKTITERDAVVDELNEQIVKIEFEREGLDFSEKLSKEMTEAAITNNILYKNRTPETLEELIIAQMGDKQRRLMLQQSTNYFASYGEEAAPVLTPVLSSQLPNYRAIISADELSRTLKAHKGGISAFLSGRPGEIGSPRGMAEGAYNFFDSLWKPAILLRFGYPIRNAIEGLASASTSLEGIWHMYPMDNPLGPAEPVSNFVRNRFGDMKSTFMRQYVSGKIPDPSLILELRNAGVEEASTFMKAGLRKALPRNSAWHIKRTEKEYNAIQGRLIQIEEKAKEIRDDLLYDVEVEQQRIARIFDSPVPRAAMMKYPGYAEQLGKYNLAKVIDDANDDAIARGLSWKEQKAYVLQKRDEYMKYWEEAQDTLLKSLKETYEKNKEVIEVGSKVDTELMKTVGALNEGLAFYGNKLKELIEIQQMKGSKYNRYMRIKKDQIKIPVLGVDYQIPSFGAGEVGEFATAYASSGANWSFLTTNPAAFDASAAILNYLKKRSDVGRRTLYPPNYVPKQGELALEGVDPKFVPPQPTTGYRNFGVTEKLDVVPQSRENLAVANTEDDYWYAVSEMAKFFKKDSIGKRLLANESREDLIKFVMSRELPESQRMVIAMLSGDAYAAPYVIGKESATRYVNFVGDIMERTFPNTQARKQISEAAGDVIPPSQLRVWFDYERKNNLLNPVIGPELEMLNPNTVKKIAGGYKQSVAKLFNFFGTMPEDNWIVNPFLSAVYSKSMAEMIKSAVKQKQEITPALLNKMVSSARRTAVSSRKKDLYNIVRYSGISAGLGYTVPFVHAIENTFRRWGRLIGRHPFAPRNLALIWGIPERNNLIEKDEKGNSVFTFSMDIDHPFVPEWVETAMKNGIKFPQGAINVALQGDPWFNPGSYPFIQATANEILNQNPHIDSVIKDKLGVAVPARWILDLFVQNPTEDSIELLTTPGIRRIQSMIGKTKADDYALDYVSIQQSEWSIYRRGDRDSIPTHQEIENKTMGLYMLRLGTAYGLPVPIQFKKPLSFYQDKARDYREKYGSEWEGRFYADWPDYFDMVFAMLENRTNTPPSTDAIYKLNRYRGLVEVIDSPIGGFNNADREDSDLISFITRKWGTIEEYDPHARNYLLTKEIGQEPISKFRDPEEVAAANQIKRGWLEYEQYKLWEEETLEKASAASISQGGSAVTSINQKNAIYIDGNGQVRNIKDAKDDFLKAAEDPRTGNPVWLANFRRYDSEGWKNSIRVIKMLTNHKGYIDNSPTLRDKPDVRKQAMRFVEDHENDAFWDTTQEYLQGRDLFVKALQRREAAGIEGGGNIEAKVNLGLQMEYNAWVDNLKANGHPGFAEIYNRFLSQDKLTLVE
jgi:hypothetical protein